LAAAFFPAAVRLPFGRHEQGVLAMLVLTRKAGERIRIGDKVTLVVVRINGNAVRLGVEAPPEYVIARNELISPAAPRAAKAAESIAR
jgi:carbon storage regulator